VPDNVLKKAHIFGISNGSLVVIRFAAKYPERTEAIIHYGIYRFTDKYKKMSGIGANIVGEFGVGNGSMGTYFLTRMFGTPPLIEEWVTNRFEESLSADAWKAMRDVLFARLWSRKEASQMGFLNINEVTFQIRVESSFYQFTRELIPKYGSSFTFSVQPW